MMQLQENTAAPALILGDLAPVSSEPQPRIYLGVGRCAKCTCTVYEDALTGNDYCKCGHAYSDHW
jgi:hypothetical protein